MAHLLDHNIVPLLVLKRYLGLTAQTGVWVQLFRQPRPAPGVVDHLCSGQVSQHLWHIIGEDKAVAQHEDPHNAAPYLFGLLSTAIIHGFIGRGQGREA